MTVHHHDPDLIMELAAGTLPADTVRPVAADVAGCERCTADLAFQRTALAALAALAGDPATRLTELEAHRLHRSLDEELARPADVPAAVRPAAASAGRRFSWGPLVTVAAVFLALVVGGNAIRSLTSDNDDSAGAETVAADQATASDAAEPMNTTSAGEAGGDTDEQREMAPLDMASTTASPVSDAGSAEAGTTAAIAQAAVTVDDLTLLWDELVDATATEEAAASPLDDAAFVTMFTDRLAGLAFVSVVAEDVCVGAATAFLSEPVDTVVVGTIELVDLGPTVLTVNLAPDGTARLLLHEPIGCTVVDEVFPVQHP